MRGIQLCCLTELSRSEYFGEIETLCDTCNTFWVWCLPDMMWLRHPQLQRDKGSEAPGEGVPGSPM